MFIVILTSGGHPYANLLLNLLIRRGAFAHDRVLVYEQHCLVPGRGNLSGLLHYLKVSGVRYVLTQVVKLQILRLTGLLQFLRGERQSSYYPYYRQRGGELSRVSGRKMALKQFFLSLKGVQPDVILSLYSREILPSAFLRIPRFGCVNLHPSLLPSYRGVSPTFWCLAEGQRKTGVTLHTMVEEVDAGGILLQEEVETDGCATEHALYLRCTERGAELVERFLKMLRSDEVVCAFQGGRGEPSYHSLPTREGMRMFSGRGYRFFSFKDLLQCLS